MASKIFNRLKVCFRILTFIISSFYLCLSGKQKKYNAYLKSVKDKYKGKRCFIIGNGPSLKKEDLEKLSNEVTFASNRIFNIFSKTEWRPTYYGIFDDIIFNSKDVFKNINSFDCEMKFFRQNGYLKSYRVNEPVCYIHSRWRKGHIISPKFSNDLTKCIYSISTVTYIMMQIARYMGFSEIYLIGVDHKYANEKKEDGTIVKNDGIKSYFGEKNHEAENIAVSSWQMEIAYQYAEKYSRENGFRIYNATRGGYLEVFERVDFDSLFIKDGNNES